MSELVFAAERGRNQLFCEGGEPDPVRPVSWVLRGSLISIGYLRRADRGYLKRKVVVRLRNGSPRGIAIRLG